MTWKERERAFYIGAPLAIVPGLCFLPTVTFLLITPRVAHALAMAVVVLPILGIVGSFGLWKLSMGAVQRPFGILNALSAGALFVLLVIAGYTGLFLALVTARL